LPGGRIAHNLLEALCLLCCQNDFSGLLEVVRRGKVPEDKIFQSSIRHSLISTGYRLTFYFELFTVELTWKTEK